MGARVGRETGQQLPPDYHALYVEGPGRTRNAGRTGRVETPSLSDLESTVGGLDISVNEATGYPDRISIQQPESRLTPRGVTASSPAEAATQFVEARGGLWDLTTDDVGTVQTISVSERGVPVVRLNQSVDGVEVFDSEVKISLTRENEPISVAGQFFSGAAASGAARRAAAVLPAEEAIAKAASDLTSQAYTADDFEPGEAPPDSGPYRFYAFKPRRRERRPRFERPARVKDVLFPLGGGRFAPGYYVELWIDGFPPFSYVIEADPTATDLLFRKNLSTAAFQYRVHNTGDTSFRPHDGPAPGSPHPTGKPNGFQAKPIPETMITLDSLLPGDPWLPAGATTTDGNNCIAYADLKNPNGFGSGDVMGKVTAPGVFGQTYNHSKPATDPKNLQNSIVGMFFHVNWLHDRWYEAGFDEASGNAQKNNFGRGGLGGDPILAEGNDFSGSDNANMATPPDGASPRMQMYRFDGPSPSPSRTSNHEALITFHEMGHYITNRLVGNGIGLTNQQGKAMGEGWGDFFAACMTSQSSDDFRKGCFAVGGWTDVTPTFKDNYYFSIRRYPYSVDMTKNPLTFKHISSGAILPAGPPRQPTSGGPNAVHNAGEVWCSALWEVFVNLVNKHGHADAEERMLQYVVGGLKATPSQPTFTAARDGIVSAATALDPGDLPEIWRGFAKRGMGRSAVAPPQTSTGLTEVVEDFTA